MSEAKRIHFGWFVHWKRVEKGKSLKIFGAKAGIGEKRMWEIEQMESPQCNETTLYGLATACEMSYDEFEKAWTMTPVRKPARRNAGNVRDVRAISVSRDTYRRLEVIASRLNQTVPEYLREHAVSGTRDLRPIGARSPKRKAPRNGSHHE